MLACAREQSIDYGIIEAARSRLELFPIDRNLDGVGMQVIDGRPDLRQHGGPGHWSCSPVRLGSGTAHCRPAARPAVVMHDAGYGSGLGVQENSQREAHGRCANDGARGLRKGWHEATSSPPWKGRVKRLNLPLDLLQQGGARFQLRTAAEFLEDGEPFPGPDRLPDS